MLWLPAAAQHGPRGCLPDGNPSALAILLRLILLRIPIAKLAVAVGLALGVMAETGEAADFQRWSGGEKPAFVLQDLTGAEVGLATHRGRVVFVHFFATWLSVGANFAWDHLNVGRMIDMLSAIEPKPAYDRASTIMKQGG
jgi:hypothetical protein